MPNDNSNSSQTAEDQEILLSMKNASLVALPWLLFQQDILKEAKKTIENEDHPVRNLISQFAKTAYCSQLGLRIALQNRPLGKLLAKIGEPLDAMQSKSADANGGKTSKFAESAMEFVESYEAVLHATVEEVRKKTGKHPSTNCEDPAEMAAPSKKPAKSKKSASRGRKPRAF